MGVFTPERRRQAPPPQPPQYEPPREPRRGIPWGLDRPRDRHRRRGLRSQLGARGLPGLRQPVQAADHRQERARGAQVAAGPALLPRGDRELPAGRRPAPGQRPAGRDPRLADALHRLRLGGRERRLLERGRRLGRRFGRPPDRDDHAAAADALTGAHRPDSELHLRPERGRAEQDRRHLLLERPRPAAAERPRGAEDERSGAAGLRPDRAGP